MQFEIETFKGYLPKSLTFVILLGLAIVLYLVTGVPVLVKFIVVLITSFQESSTEDLRNIGLLFAAYLGAPFIVWRSLILSVQANTAEERLIAERFAKAIDQLGSTRENDQPNFEVRLGGIYTLRRISTDNKREHRTAMETLHDYIRLTSRLRRGQVNEKTLEIDYEQDIDISAALTAIGLRSDERIAGELNEKFCIDLKGSFLVKSNLDGLRFPMIDLDNSDLRHSKLNYTDFRQASLNDTNFQNSDFTKCYLQRASLRGADLSNTNVTQEMLDSAFGIKDGFKKTKIPANRTYPTRWFDADTEATQDNKELYNEYKDEYLEFVSEQNGWRPDLGQKFNVDMVKLKY